MNNGKEALAALLNGNKKLPPVGSNVRVLEIQVVDRSTRAVYAYAVKTTHAEYLSHPDKVHHLLTVGFGKLLEAIFKPRPPEVSTEVVDNGEA